MDLTNCTEQTRLAIHSEGGQEVFHIRVQESSVIINFKLKSVLKEQLNFSPLSPMECMFMLLWQWYMFILVLVLFDLISGNLKRQVWIVQVVLFIDGSFSARLQIRWNVVDQKGSRSSAHGPCKETRKDSQRILIVRKSQLIEINWKGREHGLVKDLPWGHKHCPYSSVANWWRYSRRIHLEDTEQRA